MNQKKYVLGRGLSAILESDEVDRGEIAVGNIYSGKYQPRQHFNEVQLQELADSIKEIGILQPILVKKDSVGKYEIIAGERRWRAAIMAGLKSVPVIMRDLNEEKLYEAAIIENVQRADLNPIEEAKGIKELMDKFGYTQENVGKKLGKSRSYVANTLRLLGLPEKIQNYVFEGKLTAGHARAIMLSDSPEALADKIISENLSVRDAESISKKPSAQPRTPAQPRPPSQYAQNNDLTAIRTTLETALKTSVSINCDGNTGYLTIKFNSLEQLDDLINALAK